MRLPESSECDKFILLKCPYNGHYDKVSAIFSENRGSQRVIDADLLNNLIKEKLRRIRTADTESKMSQEKMGAVLGLSRSAVANIETGKQRISLHNIYSLCEHWNLDISELLPHLDDVIRMDYSDTDDYTPANKSAIEKLRGG